MKKVFITSLIVFSLSAFISYAQDCTGTYNSSSTSSSNNCGIRFSFLGITSHTGSITTTTTYTNTLTGETCSSSTSTGCGAGGGSWDWPWE
jgi:hypothetical protein